MARACRGYRRTSGKGGIVTDHPAEDLTSGEVDEQLVEDLLDETRGPADPVPTVDPNGDEVPEFPEPPG
jgi:hypothetical protein